MKKRLLHYDLLRIIACFGVIMIHAPIFSQMDNYDINSFAYQSSYFWSILSRWAVPIFLMLTSIMFLNPKKDININKMFKKNILRLLLSYVLWSSLYSLYNILVIKNIYASSVFITFFDGCFSGDLHMWYILMLIGIYISLPIFKNILQNIDDKILDYWIIAMFFFTSFIPFLGKLDIKFFSSLLLIWNDYIDINFLTGYTIYILLGYSLEYKNITKKQKKIIYIMSVIGFSFTILFTIGSSLVTGKPFGVLGYFYPNILFYSLGVILFFKDTISKISLKKEMIIVKLSSFTYGIYLSHVLILKILYKFGINISMAHPFISIPLVSLITFIIGSIITFILTKIPIINKYMI